LATTIITPRTYDPPDLLAMAGKLAVEYGNEKGLHRSAHGLLHWICAARPSALNTACSTTLLTIDSAYHALPITNATWLWRAAIDIGVRRGAILYQDGGTFAKDDNCRPFDADATGTNVLR